MTDRKDYRMEVRLRNNRILSRIEELGYDSVSAFAKDRKIKYQTLIGLITMRISPRTRDGFAKIALDLAASLGTDPEELFNERQLVGGARSVVRNVNEEDILQIDDVAVRSITCDPFSVIDNKMTVAKVLCSLPSRERNVVKASFGIGRDDCLTYDEIGRRLGVGRERVRQILAKAIRQLKRPSNAERLRGAINSTGGGTYR